MPKNCIIGKNILKKYGLYEGLNKETFYFHDYNACFYMYKRIILKYKKR